MKSPFVSLQQMQVLPWRPLAVFALLVSCCGAALGEGFQTAQRYTVGNGPVFVAIGDFNRDGKPDVVAANNVGNNVSVLLGEGKGNFSSPSNYRVGSRPTCVAVGDFNGDGVPDLATANNVSNNISVLLGSGDGTFQTNMQFPTGASGTASLAVGDFDGDGKMDLIAANGNSSNVTILLGKGDGTFQAPRNVSVPAGAGWVIVGDFNRDGKLDAAVTGESAIGILLGNGDGTLQPAVAYSAGGNAGQLAVSDVSDDGKLDLVVANTSSGPGTVSVLLGNGDGTFGVAINSPAGENPTSIAPTDVNGDGKPDLLVTNASAGSVSVLLGTGDGKFQTGLRYDLAAGFQNDSLAVADLDGDGHVDLAVADYDQRTVSILLGNGDGTFRAETEYGSAVFGATAGDFNRDGRPDLAVIQRSVVTVLSAQKNGRFRTMAAYFTAGIDPEFVTTADLNGDGKLDLVIANSGFYPSYPGNVSILLGNGDGSFQSPKTYTADFTPVSIAVADFNGDGKLDLAVANNYSDDVSILLGNGDGTFLPAINYNSGSGSAIAAGDFNNDGKADLAVGLGGSLDVAILLNNGDGTFQPASYFFAPYPNGVAVGDFNGDGNLDLALSARVDSVSVLLGNGDGTFPTFFTYGSLASCSAVTVGDFDKDGKLDLAVAGYGASGGDTGSEILLLLGKGDGSFPKEARFFTSQYATAMTTVDINRDGSPDLLLAGGAAELLLNTGGTFITTK